MRKSILVLTAFAAPAAIAAVGPRIGELRGSLAYEVDWSSGDIAGAAVSEIDDLNLLGPTYAGVAGQLDIRGASYDDAFDRPASGVKAEVSYGLSENLEIFAVLGFRQAGGRALVIGDVIPQSTGERLPLTAVFGDMSSVSFEAGARYYFEGEQLRPFLGASLGAEFVDEIRVAFDAADAGIYIPDLHFIDRSTLFTAGAEAGIAFSDGYNVSGMFSVGVRYASALKGDDTDMVFYGLGGVAGGEARISFPVKGSLSLRF